MSFALYDKSTGEKLSKDFNDCGSAQSYRVLFINRATLYGTLTTNPIVRRVELPKTRMFKGLTKKLWKK